MQFRVVRKSHQFKMVGVNAKRIVAFMVNDQTFGYRALAALVGNAVHSFLPFAYDNSAVAISSIRSPGPKKTVTFVPRVGCKFAFDIGQLWPDWPQFLAILLLQPVTV